MACKSGGSWARPSGDVANSMQGVSDCAKKCAGYKYFGLECPRSTVHCQCANTLSGSGKQAVSKCRSGHGHCKGPYTQGGYNMGGHGVGSVYLVSPAQQSEGLYSSPLLSSPLLSQFINDRYMIFALSFPWFIHHVQFFCFFFSVMMSSKQCNMNICISLFIAGSPKYIGCFKDSCNSVIVLK